MRPLARPITLCIAALSVLLAACGGTAAVDIADPPELPVAPAALTPDPRSAPSEPVAPRPIPDREATPATVPLAAAPLSGEDEQLVALEARWLCDVQRRAFSELSDLDIARASLLSNSGVEADAYQAFQARLESDTTLRLAVLAAFQSACQT